MTSIHLILIYIVILTLLPSDSEEYSTPKSVMFSWTVVVLALIQSAQPIFEEFVQLLYTPLAGIGVYLLIRALFLGYFVKDYCSPALKKVFHV